MSTLENTAGTIRGESLSDVLGALRRRWKLVVAIVVLCVAVGVVRHERTTKAYKATATVTFGQSALAQALLQIGNTGSGDPQVDAATNQLVAQSPAVAAAAAKALSANVPASELLSDISVSVVDNANVLAIEATSGDPAYAARLANAFANAYLSFEASSEVAQINAAQTELEQQINALPAGSADRVNLQASLQRLDELRAAAGGGSGQLIGAATPPSAPTGTSLTSTIIISALIGLALAFSIVVLLESRDQRIRTISGFEHEYGLPALAAIPQSAFEKVDASNRKENLEPFRILRSALDFVAATRPLRSLLVTSASAEEGKTTVAVNLARAYALTGRPVVLVELDLRQPSFSRHFRLSSSEGVTTVLIGRAAARDLMIEPLLNYLDVLPAGRIPPNPAELLSSPMLTDLLNELITAEGIVIIDAPPLNPVADAQALLSNPSIDAAIVVARAGRTTADEVRRARTILERHGDRPVGLVVTGTRKAEGYGHASYATVDPLVAPAAEPSGSAPGRAPR